jgi:hypothetical protein
LTNAAAAVALPISTVCVVVVAATILVAASDGPRDSPLFSLTLVQLIQPFIIISSLELLDCHVVSSFTKKDAYKGNTLAVCDAERFT